MKKHPGDRLPILSLVVMVMVITLIHIPKSLCQNQNRDYETCGQAFRCGNIDLFYPFWGGPDRPEYCGYPGFGVSCQSNTVPTIAISQAQTRYMILQTPDATAHTIRVARNDLFANNCPTGAVDTTTVNFTIFTYSNIQNLTLLYGCPAVPPPLPRPLTEFVCSANAPGISNYYYVQNSELGSIQNLVALASCSRNITVPIDQGTPSQSLVGSGGLSGALTSGFTLGYEANNEACQTCTHSNGRCGYNTTSNSFVCYCSDRAYDRECNVTSSSGNGNNNGLGTGASLGLALGGAALAGLGVGFLILWCRQKRKRIASQNVQTESKEISTPPDTKSLLAVQSVPSVPFSKSIPSYPSSTTEFGRDTSYFGVQVFTYEELEKATENFSRSRELGDGGFGAVYYGLLSDGRVVAVKRLYENNFKRVEQFMNEVEILTLLRHQNLVQLFGCTSKRSTELLLVYEYIPNGTVADHLHGKRSKSGLLSWSVRLNIAIETADALAFLHEKDVIHRDVKTNNILLDNDFHVKVADFGLSRLFPPDVTHVSTAPQGTPGYVDPEYYQCYQLTEKSDVYSFGVVLIEIISSLQAVDTNRHRQDINLANMAVNKIQNHDLHELVDPSLEFGTNSSVRRMTTLVAELAFRCLQQEREMRPSMKEVLDALRAIQKEGMNAQKAEDLEIIIDDGEHPKGKSSPLSPTSVVSDLWPSTSTPSSSA